MQRQIDLDLVNTHFDMRPEKYMGMATVTLFFWTRAVMMKFICRGKYRDWRREVGEVVLFTSCSHVDIKIRS